MPLDYRRYLPATVLLLGAAFILNARRQAAVKLAAPLTSMPPVLSGYTVRPQTLSADERRVAGMSEYVARAYYRDSVPVFTTFVSYYERQTQGQTIHSPRNCLPGAGWEVVSGGPVALDVDGAERSVNRYLLKNGPATAVVFYWYQGRGRIVANEYRVKWNLLRDAAVAGHTEEALVRVVVFVAPPENSNDADASQAAIAQATALGSEVASRMTKDVNHILPPA